MSKLIVLYGGPQSGSIYTVSENVKYLNVSYLDFNETYWSNTLATVPPSSYKFGYYNQYFYSGMALKENGDYVFAWETMSDEMVMETWQVRNSGSNPFFTDHSNGWYSVGIYDEVQVHSIPEPGEDCIF